MGSESYPSNGTLHNPGNGSGQRFLSTMALLSRHQLGLVLVLFIRFAIGDDVPVTGHLSVPTFPLISSKLPALSPRLKSDSDEDRVNEFSALIFGDGKGTQIETQIKTQLQTQVQTQVQTPSVTRTLFTTLKLAAPSSLPSQTGGDPATFSFGGGSVSAASISPTSSSTTQGPSVTSSTSQPSSSSSTTPSVTSSTEGGHATVSTTPTPSGSADPSTSSAATRTRTIGAAVGAAVGLIVLLLALLFWWRRRSRAQDISWEGLDTEKGVGAGLQVRRDWVRLEDPENAGGALETSMTSFGEPQVVSHPTVLKPENPSPEIVMTNPFGPSPGRPESYFSSELEWGGLISSETDRFSLASARASSCFEGATTVSRAHSIASTYRTTGTSGNPPQGDLGRPPLPTARLSYDP